MTGGTAEAAPGRHRRTGEAGRPGEVPGRPWQDGRAWLQVLAWAAAAALLFLAYLRVSWTVPATSDGAAQALQARDMLAGNWLLHGWTLSDVSFYPTELAEYVLVELARPFGIGVIHVAAAVTYTLLVLAAVALARGRARGREGLVRGGIAAVIMLAPQPGYGAFVLLLSPDHVGTQVPLLLGWLLVDRAGGGAGGSRAGGGAGGSRAGGGAGGGRAGGGAGGGRAGNRIDGRAGRRRGWLVPAGLCLLLAWVQLADRVALITAVLPLFIVCAVRGAQAAAAARRGPGRGHEFGLEWPLAVAAVASAGAAWAGARLLDAAGGFAGHPLPFTLAPAGLLWTHTWLTGWGILELYGANFLGLTGWAGCTFAAVHLAGLGAAIAATGIAIARFIRPGHRAAPDGAGAADHAEQAGAADHAEQAEQAGAADQAEQAEQAGNVGGLVDAVLAVAIVVNLVSYALSVEPGTVLGTGYDAREIAAVLPLGAVLAGRVLGPLLAVRLRRRERASAPGECAVAAPIATPVAHPPGSGWGRRWSSGGGEAKARPRSGALVVILTWVTLGGAAALYAGALGYAATRPAADGRYAGLARWLTAHGLRYGLGGAAANVVTADSGGRVTVAATVVRQGRVRPLLYQSSVAAYDARWHDARFVVLRAPAGGPGYATEVVPADAARATFGNPARVYRFDGFTVAVWNVNLLTKLP